MLGAAFKLFAYLGLVAGKYIHQQKFIAVVVGVQRFVDAGILAAVGTFAQVHQNFVLDTSAGVSRQLDVFGGFKGVHSLDKPNRTD